MDRNNKRRTQYNDIHWKVWNEKNNYHLLIGKIRRPCLALAEAGRRLGPPQVWNFAFGNRPKQHRSRPAMPPQCPATPRTAVIWLPKATDGTSGLKGLAAPQLAQSSSSNGAKWPARPRTAVMWIPKATDGTSGLKGLAAPQLAQSSSSNGATVASQAQDSSYMASESAGWHLGLENPRRASAGPVFVQQRRLRGQDSSYMASESDGWHLGLENPRRASAGPVFVQQWRLCGQPGPGQQLCGFRKRRMAPRAWKASPRLSWPSLRPAMAPQWPARPRTAVIWLPKAPDGTSGLKTLAAPQPAQSSSSNGASVVRTAVIWLPKATDGTSGLKTLAAPQPAQSSSSNGASVASQAQDSSYVDSESDGWHLGLERPRRASVGPVFVQQWRHSGQPGPGQQLYGFRKRRMAPRAWKPSPRLSRPSLRPATAPPWSGQQLYGFRKRRMAPWAWKASPRLSWPSLRPAMAPQWPARPRTAVIWLPKAPDGTSGLKTLAAPQPAQSSSSNGASVVRTAVIEWASALVPPTPLFFGGVGTWTPYFLFFSVTGRPCLVRFSKVHQIHLPMVSWLTTRNSQWCCVEHLPTTTWNMACEAWDLQ